MKTASRIILIVMALSLAVSLSGLPALAQDKPADNMQIVREKVKADKRLFVAQAMGLTESEAKAFWPVYDNYQKKLTRLNDRAYRMIQDYAKNYRSMTNAPARKLTDEFIAIKAEQQKLMVSYLPQFRKVLPEIKVARYYQVENKVSAVVNYELAMNITLVE
jgi:Spy/CpxP family protein refolding chaperone